MPNLEFVLGIRMRKTFLTTLVILLTTIAWSQQMRGLINSNYAGIQGVLFNPANLADSRTKFDFNVVSFGIDANNNHVDVHTPYSQWKALRDVLPERYYDQNGVPIFRNEFVNEKLNGRKKNFYASAEVTGPSFQFNLSDKSGFAFSNRTRAFVSLAGLNEDLLKIFLEDMDTVQPGYTPLQNQDRYIGQRNQQKAMGFGASAWQEFNLSYARVLLQDKEHFLKAGVTLKYLIGLGAANIYVNDLDYELVARDSIHIYSADMGVSYVSETYFDNPDLRLNDMLGQNKLGRGFGVDLGVVYEYRPDYKKYRYRMDRKTHEDRSESKYLFKIGASINDFGSITYDVPDVLTRITVNSNSLVKWSNFNSIQKLGGTTDADSFVYDLFSNSDSVNRFKSKLPTSLNLNFDYKIQDNFYVGGSYVQSLRTAKVQGVKKQNVVALTGRYEKRWFGASVSVIGGNFYHPVHFGAMIRAGAVYIGTDHLGGILGAKKTDGASLYAGLRWPIHYNRIKDSDNDGVSDDRDKCADVPGSIYASGCPDEDGDKVADKDDKCPDVPGKRNTEGCPDEDGDGVYGEDDKCPDKAGTKDDMGCPDSDGDGLADYLDKCPDEKGPKDLDGCPYKEEKDTVVQDSVEDIDTPKTESDTGIATEYDHIIDKMDFDKYNYYIILGAYTNKDYADYLVNSLDTKANVETFIFREVGQTMYYVTFGKATNKKTAKEQVQLLSRPEVNSLINGHIWWKKLPR